MIPTIQNPTSSGKDKSKGIRNTGGKNLMQKKERKSAWNPPCRMNKQYPMEIPQWKVLELDITKHKHAFGTIYMKQ